ncbi:MAG: 16S rRNA (cytosine(1402)-N(4))-methyltransferase RsmH [Flammeovirgaceae bacterium]
MYHIPVMLEECLEGLAIEPNSILVDVTFGGGGHAKEMLKGLVDGKLYAFDQDEDAIKNAEGLDKARFQLIESNFRNLKRYLRLHGCSKVDGILGDLGVSSHQIDTADRGFSLRMEGELDMRMDQSQKLSAKVVVNEYEEKNLADVLWLYGELRNSRKLAREIVSQRKGGEIQHTTDLVKLLNPFAPRGRENQFHARVFQALRIEVNDEMGALKDLLVQSMEVLKEGGRLVIMSYHSLEDRLVKNFMRSGNFEGKVEKDFYGNPLVPFKLINRKPIVASAEEVAANPRARSAKLRVAERIEIKK